MPNRGPIRAGMSEISISTRGRERVPDRDQTRLPLAQIPVGIAAPPLAIEYDSASPPLPQPGAISLDVSGDLADVESEWKAFEASADCTPFQTFDWLNKWQRHIGMRTGAIPAVVLGRDESGELLFILPLAIEARRTLRLLTWLGTDLGDYNAPLLSPRFVGHNAAKVFAVVWRAVVRKLQSNPRFQFDLIDLQKMPELTGRQRNPFLSLDVLTNSSGAYVTTLGSNWEQYYTAKRSASTRKTARRKQRQLEELGDLRFVEAADPEEAKRTLETLIEQKSCWFARMGVKNIFSRPGYPEFYLDVATDPAMSSLVYFSRLDVGTAVGSTSLALRHRGRCYLILSSYHPGELSRFGPGTAHLHELLRSAIGGGFHSFDFTIGDEPYKRDWAETRLVLYDYLAGETLRGRLAVSAAFFTRRLKRFVKQTPFLWQLVVRVRAFKARLRGAANGTVDEQP